jgi:hypothetical protein
MAKFKKGHKPWNSGLKGLHLSPDTEFKKGVTTMENHPSWKGGEQHFKHDCAYINIGTNKRIRRPKKVYEYTHGTIPKGWIIYHLNGDRYNDSLENLIAIPRAVLIKINSGRMNVNYHEIKQAVEKFKNK